MTIVNVNNKKSRKIEYIYIFIACLAIYIFKTIWGDGEEGTMMSLALMGFVFIGLFINAFAPLSIWSFVYILGFTVPGNYQIIIWLLCFLPIVLKFSKKLPIQEFLIIMCAVCIFSISYILGVDTDQTSWIIQIFSIIAYVFVLYHNQGKKTAALLLFALLCAAVFASIDTLFQIANDPMVFIDNRLSYEDNIRAMANILTIPIYYLVFSILTRNEQFKKHKILMIISMIVFSVLLFLTYSRGNLLAIAATVFIVSLKLFSKHSKKMITFLAVMIFLLCVIVYSGALDIDKLFNSNTAGERFDIWRFYTQKVVDGGWERALFGYGPGDIRRVAQGEYLGKFYAHSTIMDYFFSYGLFGLSFLVFLIINTFHSIMRNKSVFDLGLFLLTLLMFAPFGNAQHLIFHILLALSAAGIYPYKSVQTQEWG